MVRIHRPSFWLNYTTTLYFFSGSLFISSLNHYPLFSTVKETKVRQKEETQLLILEVFETMNQKKLCNSAELFDQMYMGTTSEMTADTSAKPNYNCVASCNSTHYNSTINIFLKSDIQNNTKNQPKNYLKLQTKCQFSE